ncbi:heavy metal-responsive transcriptional regulator [Phytoactinopolyspora halotolerans]|uniref:Heavy metal-responsive transcriptional regulator n=1 Tax=Phytoactinopolyspora halotolerans TaxID=1981512 RepID=A0A6L9SIN6_9ACTN|nr:heavy metal-responsive transcriptional regulator [Phytoactinopolyspora halotolerans]NEE04534.1 heavy metal-responsive transcriptional regulator [Phytoactinopolyspora halotolerans]
MLIGELARRAGTTAKTLRFYEDEGLLPDPGRTASGYRDYPAELLDRVVFIRDAQTAGLTLRQIREILAIRDGGQPPCEHAGQLIGDRLADVQRRISELEQTRSRLLELAGRASTLDPADCGGYCDIIQRPAAAD